MLNSLINKRNSLQFLSVIVFLVLLTFIDRTHQASYILFQVVAVLNLFLLPRKKIFCDKFFIYYGLVLCWGIVVTILSPVAHDSFIALRYWLLPLVLFVALYDADLISILKKSLWVPSVLLLIANIVLFMYWTSNGAVYSSTGVVYQKLYYLIGDWTSKIYTSTVVLCILVFVWFYLEKSIHRNILIIMNLISGLLSYDRMFWFSLAIILICYYFLEKIKLSFCKIIFLLVSIIISIVLIALLLHYIGMDLHYKERFATYQYWFSVVHVSPVVGIGVGRDSLQHFYGHFYPVSAELIARNPFTPYTSHNFFLDLQVSQGVIGLLIYMIMLTKINITSYKNAIVKNNKYEFVTLYITLAIFTKFLVDNQLDNRKVLVFWFFIVASYLINKVNDVDVK